MTERDLSAFVVKKPEEEAPARPVAPPPPPPVVTAPPRDTATVAIVRGLKREEYTVTRALR